MTTTVFDLETGNEYVYSLPPELAVVCAFEQHRARMLGIGGNFNTWSYDFSKAKLSNSGRTVYYGDFAAVMKH